MRSPVTASPRTRLLLLVLALAALPAGSQERAFDFSGTQRARYESLDGQFLTGLDERDEVLALQTSLRFESRTDRLRFVGEILDSRAELNDAGSFVNNTVVNSLEPIQAYVAWTPPRQHASEHRAGAACGPHDTRPRQTPRHVAQPVSQYRQ